MPSGRKNRAIAMLDVIQASSFGQPNFRVQWLLINIIKLKGDWLTYRYQLMLFYLSIITISINSQQIQHIEMPETKSGNRYIPRFQLKKRIHTNPQQHQKTPASYFSKIGRDNSLLNGEKIRVISKLDQSTNNSNLKTYVSSKLNLFNSTSHSFKLKTNDQKPRFNNISQQKTEFHNKPNKANPSDLKDPDASNEMKKKQYLSYLEYENLLQSGKILPNYFQKIANKNDQKSIPQQVRDIPKYAQKKVSKSTQKQNILKIKAQMIEGIENLRQKFKLRLIPQPTLQQAKPIKTIISSNLGILSNHSIRQKLEEKWEKQIKYQTVNKLLMTEESQMAQEKDTRQISVRDDSNVWSLKKKIKKEAENEDSSLNTELQIIQNEKQRERLMRIFSKRQKPTSAQQKVSRGEEYELFQQNMFKINSSYKPKKYILKHKIEWRV